MEISKWAMVLGSTGNSACAASCYVLCVAMQANVGGVGLPSVGARHAVPGERTWRGPCHASRCGVAWFMYRRPPAGVFELCWRVGAKGNGAGETPAVRNPLPEISLCGEWVAACQASRSGTACRAPTEETAKAKRTLRFSCAKHRDRAALLRGHRQECLCY